MADSPYSDIVNTGTTLLTSYLTFKAKSDALKEAGDQRSLEQARMIDLQIELLEQGRPLREAQFAVSEEAVRQIGEDISRAPGESETFKRGLKGLAGNLAAFGVSPESGAFGAGAGEALSRDIERLESSRFRAAGLAPDTLSTAVGLFPGISEIGGDIANLTLGKGLTKSAFIKDVGDIGAGTFAG